MFSTSEILDLAIRIEKNGEAVYRQAADKISNPDLVSLLSWMADEEAEHARWFSEFRSKAARGSDNPFLEEMGHELFNDLLGDKNFRTRIRSEPIKPLAKDKPSGQTEQ